MDNEQHTTLDQLDASLGELLKAVGETKTVDALRKGDGLSIQGGRGDNFASTGDAGKLDDMMIAKMVQDGVITEQQGKAMLGYAEAGGFLNVDRPSPTGKADDDFGGDDEGDEDEDEGYEGKAGPGFGDDDGDEAPPAPPMRGKRRLAKSHLDEFNDDLGEMVDVAPFLEAFTERTAKSFDRIEKSMRKSRASQTEVNKHLAKSLVGLAGLVKSQQNVIRELGNRLGIVERTPAPQRGVTGARALSKALPGEAGGAGGEKLTKSDIASTLSYMSLEKGIHHIGGTPMSQLVSLAEAGGIAAPETIRAVEQFLKTHPNEAQVARTYQ